MHWRTVLCTLYSTAGNVVETGCGVAADSERDFYGLLGLMQCCPTIMSLTFPSNYPAHFSRESFQKDVLDNSNLTLG